MAKSKEMNETVFAKLMKNLGASGELIRSRQKEKQALMDSFDAEKRRYRAGKISEATLKVSVKRTNKELARLDKQIREAIRRVGKVSSGSREFAARQSPKAFRATISGVKAPSSSSKKSGKKTSRKKTSKRKSSKKKVKRLSPKIKKLEMRLDREYQKKRKR